MGKDLINELLKRHRLRNDAALSRKLGCTRGEVSKLRSGKTEWSKSFFTRVEGRLHMPFEEIFGLMEKTN